MRKIISSFLLVFIILFPGCKKSEVASNKNADDCFTTNSLTNGAIIEDQYIISYRSVDAQTSTSALRIAQVSKDVLEQNGINASALRISFSGDVRGFVANLTKEEALKIKSSGIVETVEPDRIIALNTCFTVVAPGLITWNVRKTGYGDGTGKTAWVFDTGIDSDHPDLNVDINRSRSFLSNNNSTEDENGHGTHVAGIIGAKNNTLGVLGVASGANLVSIRILDKEGVGTLSSTIQALSYVSANAKAGDVINLSFGEDGISETLDRQVKAVAAKGIFVTIAAGNDSKAANLFSPARANGANIYTVSAIDSLDNFASFSNFGNDVVDYAAPGVRIVSTYKDGNYARMSGTSQAAPHIAGLLLLNGANLRFSATAKNDNDGSPDKIAMK